MPDSSPTADSHEAFDAAMSVTNAHGGVERLLERAERHVARHDVAQALSALRDACHVDPSIRDTTRYWVLYAEGMSQAIANAKSGSDNWFNATQAAMDGAQDLLRIAPADPIALRVAAHVRAASGFLSDAEMLAREALRIDPTNPSGFATYAHVLTRAGEPEAALRLVAQGLQLDPEDERLLTARRDALYVMGDRTWVDSNRELLRRDPMNAPALHMDAYAAARRGNFEAATTSASSAAREFAGSNVATSQARSIAALDHWSLRPIRSVLLRGGGWWLWLAMIYGTRLIAVAIYGTEHAQPAAMFMFLPLALYVYVWPRVLRRRSRW